MQGEAASGEAEASPSPWQTLVRVSLHLVGRKRIFWSDLDYRLLLDRLTAAAMPHDEVVDCRILNAAGGRMDLGGCTVGELRELIILLVERPARAKETPAAYPKGSKT